MLTLDAIGGTSVDLLTAGKGGRNFAKLAI